MTMERRRRRRRARLSGSLAAASTVALAVLAVVPMRAGAAEMPPVPFDPEPVPAAAATTGKSAPAPADDGGFTPVTPARLLDTRNGAKPANSTTTTLAIAGQGGGPASGAVAVQLTVTVPAPDRPGFVTAFPCGADVPTASNVNYAAGQTIPNAVTVRLDAKGQTCLFNSASTHLVVDVTGWYGPGKGRFAAVTPSRVVD